MAQRLKYLPCRWFPYGLSHFIDHNSHDEQSWYYEGGLTDYLTSALGQSLRLPDALFTGDFTGDTEQVSWAFCWLPDGGELLAEAYVNLIPTPQGGTHVNGLRQGLLDALREFCEYRNLLPRAVKLAPDDVWERCCYILSLKMQEPQFQDAKERLSHEQPFLLLGLSRCI